MRALILAAGMGTRLESMSLDNPKCLVKVNDKTILEKILDNINNVGIEKATIVVGYLSEKIIRKISNKYKKIEITYVENQHYATTGTAYSLQKGIRSFENNENVFVIEGDVFFDGEILKDFSLDGSKNYTYVEKYTPELEGTFVELDNNSIVTKWLHRDMRTSEESVNHMYKTINIHHFTSNFLKHSLNYSLERQISFLGEKNSSLEKVMNEIVISRVESIYALINKSRKWVEIDDKNDLDRAKKKFIK